jgi:hypothetical protein
MQLLLILMQKEWSIVLGYMSHVLQVKVDDSLYNTKNLSTIVPW